MLAIPHNSAYFRISRHMNNQSHNQRHSESRSPPSPPNYNRSSENALVYKFTGTCLNRRDVSKLFDIGERQVQGILFPLVSDQHPVECLQATGPILGLRQFEKYF